MINRSEQNWPDSEVHSIPEDPTMQNVDIYTALYNARNGNGKVYAQDGAGTWLGIDAAKETASGLWVRWVAGRWFTPQKWEVRSR